MIRRFVIYLTILITAFIIICLVSVIQHWDYISQNSLDSLGVILSSSGILFIIVYGLYHMLKSIRK